MMNPQDHYFGAFAPPSVNRSPSASRAGFNTTSGHPFSSRFNPQRPLEPFGHSPGPMFDDRFMSLSNDVRRMQFPQQNYDSSFLIANNLAWAHNSGVSTVNGMTDATSRFRQTGRRGALPAEWMTPDQSSQAIFSAPNGQFETTGIGHFNHPMGLINGGAAPNLRHGYDDYCDNTAARQTTPRQLNPDLIPTAIVIKNIPFNVRKEHLAQVMADMNLPTPYAFNYHFDNGVFRGLAFANFQNAEDTYHVIQKLNGQDVNGRKLRVEYKKMLPEAERERIEREKREKRGQLEEQHQPLTLHSQASLHSLNAAAITESRAPVLAPDPVEIDYNDTETRNFLIELTMFQREPSREVFIFPPDLTGPQRRKVHTLAQHMGLHHESVGEGSNRQLRVMKKPLTQDLVSLHPPPAASLDAHRRGLSRAATIDFGETRNPPNQYNIIGRSGMRPTLELPSAEVGLNAANLRGVKSFADLRSYTPSPSPSMSGYMPPNGMYGGGQVAHFADYSNGLQGRSNSLATPTTPGSGTLGGEINPLVANFSTLSLSEPYAATGQLKSRDAPGAIGSHRPGNVAGANGRTLPERQPFGPGNPERGELGTWRCRQNGHSQRNSDSSDSAARGANAGISRGL